MNKMSQPEEEIDTLEEEATHFVAYHEGSPIAAGRLRVVGGYGKVERICVLKEARKTGAWKSINEQNRNLCTGKWN